MSGVSNPNFVVDVLSNCILALKMFQQHIFHCLCIIWQKKLGVILPIIKYKLAGKIFVQNISINYKHSGEPCSFSGKKIENRQVCFGWTSLKTNKQTNKQTQNDGAEERELIDLQKIPRDGLKKIGCISLNSKYSGQTQLWGLNDSLENIFF